ncbi:MAG: tRNA (N6-isopentenyl adenosine(37)-C2)-methylthiotransferase MiaB [Proteobacteria bacterium]|nr:tRNA (N6-isopentenyl adenosine(37)-C2)-methylthiotransferase MiaB [Pseudomonadota bacterium]
MKVLIETYGCQMNTADSELIQGILRTDGFETAHTLEEADILILNTCAVREKAEARIMGRLTNFVPLKKQNPNLLIGVVGCMAKHLGHDIVKKIPYVDFVVGPDNYRRLPAILRSIGKNAEIQTAFDRTELYAGCTPHRPRGVTAWVTIQRGCNYVCAYCIVPYVRGVERNIPAENILAEVRELAQQGCSVVTLLGQTVNSYVDKEVDFPELLRRIAAIDGIEQIRFTSPHPLGFSDELIEVIASEPKVAKFVHLPLQSASDAQLRAMRRNYTYEDYCTIVQKLRTACPQIAISTDIIVGFCGETEDDYQCTKQALLDHRFAFAFLFAYSQRSLSIAARTLPDDVPNDIKQKRLAEIIAIQQTISKEVYAQCVGKRLPVIVEGFSRRHPEQAVGNTPDFKTTLFTGGDAQPGDWVEIEIERATSQTLKGKLIRILKKGNAPQVENPIDVGISLGPTENPPN